MYARPMSTARAPSASAFTTSDPRRTPPSMSTSTRSPTAATTSGNARMVGGPRRVGGGRSESQGPCSQQLVELLVALVHAGLHAAGEEHVAAFEAVDQREAVQLRAPVAEVLERHRL